MMTAMIEYRIHGRGGQGNVAAAYLLAATAFEAGWTCQAFPAFGAERRGAPVAAFVRVSQEPIRMRSQVRTPDYLIVQDETLLLDPKITAGLKQGGGMLVNSTGESARLSDQFGCRAVCVNANGIAMKEIGRPIPNTALLAALITLTGHFPRSALSTALQNRFSGDLLAGNLRQIERAAQAVDEGAWSKEATDA